MAKWRLLPRDERFYDMFEQAASIAVAAAGTLSEMVANPGEAEALRKRISDLEHDGDSVIHDVMDRLNRTFVTPMDGEDIRAIAGHLDDIIDHTQGAAERLVLYQVTSPHGDFHELVEILKQATVEVQAVVRLLRDMGQQKAILQHCVEINRLENAGDRRYREAIGALFCEGNLVELLRWKEIFEEVEYALDVAEDLADVVEGLVVKHS